MIAVETPSADWARKGQFSTLTNAEGLKLHCRRWTPNNPPRALVILLHGFAEHLDYYEEVACALVSRDLLVFGHDHHGYGRSEGARAYTNDFNKYINDVIQHVNWLKAEYPNYPLFAVAHSMGGTIALKTLLKRPDFFQGVVLVAPCVVLSSALATPMRIFLAKVLSRIAPQLAVGRMYYSVVSHDKQMIERMKKDELRWHSGIKAKIATEMMAAIQEICKNLSSIKCPFLTLHGDRDLVVDIASSRVLEAEASSTDKSFKVYENAFHGLLVEIEEHRSRVLDDIVNWLVVRMPSSSDVKSDCGQNSESVLKPPEILSKY